MPEMRSWAQRPSRRPGPRFLTDLQIRYHGLENKREGTASVVRNVPVPYEVTALQRQYGKEYAEFYYVAAKRRRINGFPLCPEPGA